MAPVCTADLRDVLYVHKLSVLISTDPFNTTLTLTHIFVFSPLSCGLLTSGTSSVLFYCGDVVRERAGKPFVPKQAVHSNLLHSMNGDPSINLSIVF